ncbi:MAG: rod shape-determining protein MreC, partial [Verrucomicrobiota bacterium]
MSRLNIIFLIVFVGLLFWITLFKPDSVRGIQTGALSLFEPLTKAALSVEDSAEKLGEKRLSYPELEAAYNDAAQERDRLKLEVLKLDELLYENNELRTALRYTQRSKRRLIPARIIDRKPSTWYNTVMIDRGTNAGIRPDSPVVVPVADGSGLVGKVS